MRQSEQPLVNYGGQHSLFPVDDDVKSACATTLLALSQNRVMCPKSLLEVLCREFRAVEAAIVAESAGEKRWTVLLGSEETTDLVSEVLQKLVDGIDVSIVEARGPTPTELTVAWFPSGAIVGDGRKVALILVDAVLLNDTGRISHRYGHEVLGGLVKLWAGRVGALRVSVGRARRRLESGRLTESERKDCCRLIDKALADQSMVLGARDAFAALRQRMRHQDEMFDSREIFSGTVLNECWKCRASQLRLCDRPLLHRSMSGELDEEKEKRLFKTLVDWTCWCGIGPLQIGPLRRPAHHGNCGTAAKRLACTWIDFNEQVSQLASDATESVDPALLDQRALIRFFLSRALDQTGPGAQEMFSLFPPSRLPSDEEMAGALKNLATVAHYVFADIPLEAETIEAIIWLTSEYLHRALGLPRVFDIKAYLLTAAREEPALHALKTFYRDHFFHALQVCFLGHYVLEKTVKTRHGEMPLWKMVAPLLFSEVEDVDEGRRLLLRLWYLTALLHDVAYSVDVAKGAVALVKKLGKSGPLKSFVRGMEMASEQLSADLANEGFLAYVESHKPGEDHGVVAARHLTSLVKAAAISDTSIDAELYQPVIRAIAVHNSRVHEVSFGTEPLSFLLVLCDTVQEWNRMQLGGAGASVELLSRLVGPAHEPLANEGPVARVALLDIPTTRAKRGDSEPPPGCLSGHGIAFRLDYDHSIQANCGVFNVWIDATCNLQRLRFDGAPEGFDICLEFVTPLRLNSDGNRYPQLYRLRDAARDTHMGFLEDWFPTQDDAVSGWFSNGAIQYGVFTDGASGELREHLVLDLRRLSEKRRVKSEMKEFRTRLEKWRHYPEDRDYRGDYAMPDMLG